MNCSPTETKSEADWVLMRWHEGTDVFTPYIDGPRHWAKDVEGFSADWVEIANGSYEYIKRLRGILEKQQKLESEQC